MPKVEVDWTKCNGCGACADNCPALVFEVQELPDYTDSKKSVSVRADDCVLCMTCVSSCPTGAVTVEEK
ncbi:TPA: 4Fe-4S binding protein [Candidatus Bathyarchaeota archaeon]|nr:4Fe-4S binding protein [Candidatus Bathyarchaeota archaeon]HIJ08445.1 4Fe-4S binding protein [Candidatus Bathyarchaeota archaeon]